MCMPHWQEVYLNLHVRLNYFHKDTQFMCLFTFLKMFNSTSRAQNTSTYLFLFSRAVLSICMYRFSGTICIAVELFNAPCMPLIPLFDNYKELSADNSPLPCGSMVCEKVQSVGPLFDKGTTPGSMVCEKVQSVGLLFDKGPTRGSRFVRRYKLWVLGQLGTYMFIFYLCLKVQSAQNLLIYTSCNN